MRISKLQLRLTLIFLLVLLIPSIIAIILTRYILTMEKRGMDVDEKVEAVLQEASQIAYDIIDKTKEECQAIAEELSSDTGLISRIKSSDDLKSILRSKFTSENELFSAVLTNDGKIILPSASVDISSALIDRIRQEKSSFSYQENDIIYGSAPIIRNGKPNGYVIIYQKLNQELVKNIIDLQNLLKVYAFRQEFGAPIWLGLIAFMVILALFGAILAAILARNVTKPILKLVAGTREVAKGNLDHQVEISSKPNRNDEIDILIISFNTMISQLKTSQERLVVAERLAAWRDIARRIAHEIKNPLTPIQLSMYRLKKNLGSEKYNEIFDQAYNSITREVDNLRNMVTEFSQFARMPKPRLQPSSPKDIIQNAINLYTGLPENINLKVNLDDFLPQIEADKDQIRQVLHNLIGNAVDAMPEGGNISITARQETESFVSIEVADTGHGMSEEVRQKIFTPYFTTKEKGTGLGMAITAQIIEEHGGEIILESKEGLGTKVKIKIKGLEHRT